VQLRVNAKTKLEVFVREGVGNAAEILGESLGRRDFQRIVLIALR
jgi:hypothetical protein